MATTSAVELDFFRLEKESSSAAGKFHRRRSFRDIQRVISKLNPELLKSVIASGGGASDLSAKSSGDDSFLASDLSISVHSSPEREKVLLPSISPNRTIVDASNGYGIIQPESAPLTIFYNGTVAVFDVPSHKAEEIMKFAKSGASQPEEVAIRIAGSLNDQQQQPLLEMMSGGDLPMARKKSLQRFMQKRKQRAIMAFPYASN